MPRKLLAVDDAVFLDGAHHLVSAEPGNDSFYLSRRRSNRTSASAIVGGPEAFEYTCTLYYGYKALGNWPVARSLEDLTRFVFFLETHEVLKDSYATPIQEPAPSTLSEYPVYSEALNCSPYLIASTSWPHAIQEPPSLQSYTDSTQIQPRTLAE